MAGLKRVGFEQATLASDSELFFVFGNPVIVSNVNPLTGDATLWNDETETWDSVNVPWGLPASTAPYEPGGVRSGYYALRVQVGDFFDIKASTNGGGGYDRIYVNIKQLPDSPTSLCYFIRDTDDVNMVTIELQPDGSLRTYYRDDANTGRTYLGQPSNRLEVGRYHAIEMGIFGLPDDANRTIECRVDHIRYMQETVTDLSAYDGYFGSGPNYDADDAADVASWYCDDLATNDGFVYDYDDQNTWPGPGKLVLLPVAGDDGALDQVGWTRGGVDTGSDWGQVREASPPNDGVSYLVGGIDAEFIDFRLGNPYDVGIRPEDTIKCVVADVRWSMQDESEGASIFVYLRAGSNLSQRGNTIELFGTDWFSNDAGGRSPDTFTTSFLPDSTARWNVDELASARIGMEVVDSVPDIYIGALWAYVEYDPHTNETEYEILIDGVDRTNEVKLQSLRIEDILNDQANTAKFQMYNLGEEGVPERGEIIEVWLNGVQLFGGLLTKVGYTQLTNSRDIYDIQCVDYTRILDRRMVSATYQNMTDLQIIEAIIEQYAGDEDITTYHVSEGVLINQISFNYVPVSRALQQIAKLTGRQWFIDYQKDIHYFPLVQARAPFEITSAGNQHLNFQLVKDDSQLRNRVFVRGGTELTTEPITERSVSDGESRQYLLAEKPHDITVTINAVPATVGIKNIDDAALFDVLVNFQQKYIELGSAFTTPPAGQVIEVSYNYDVPVLVAVEDTNSIQEEAAKSGGSGVYEFAIIDKQINSTEQARERAAAELTDYAAGLIESSYTTMEKGLRSGQYQRVTMSNKGVDEDYVVTKVVFQSLGGGLFTYGISLSNAKTIGIIRFLIEMLEINRSVGEFDPNEKVDQFFSLTDQLDSFTDSLTIDSQGLGFPWAVDSPSPTGKHLRWNLGQWS